MERISIAKARGRWIRIAGYFAFEQEKVIDVKIRALALPFALISGRDGTDLWTLEIEESGYLWNR